MLVAHNGAGFDMPILVAELSRCLVQVGARIQSLRVLAYLCLRMQRCSCASLCVLGLPSVGAAVLQLTK